MKPTSLRPFAIWMINADDESTPITSFLTCASTWEEAIRLAKAGAIASGWWTEVQDLRDVVGAFVERCSG